MTTAQRPEGKPTQSVRQTEHPFGSHTHSVKHAMLTQAPGGQKKTLSAAKSSPGWAAPRSAYSKLSVRLVWLDGAECRIRVSARGHDRIVSGCISLMDLMLLINGC